MITLEYIKFAFVCIGLVILAVAVTRHFVEEGRRLSLRAQAKELLSPGEGTKVDLSAFLSRVTTEDIAADAYLKWAVDQLMQQKLPPSATSPVQSTEPTPPNMPAIATT